MTRHEIVCVDFSVFEIPDHDPDPNPLEVLINREDQETAGQVTDFRNALVGRLVRQLPKLEHQVISWRYGLAGHEPMSDEQIAQRLGMSRSGVWRIRQRALETLRSADQAQVLEQAG